MITNRVFHAEKLSQEHQNGCIRRNQGFDDYDKIVITTGRPAHRIGLDFAASRGGCASPPRNPAAHADSSSAAAPPESPIVHRALSIQLHAAPSSPLNAIILQPQPRPPAPARVRPSLRLWAFFVLDVGYAPRQHVEAGEWWVWNLDGHWYDLGAPFGGVVLDEERGLEQEQEETEKELVVVEVEMAEAEDKPEDEIEAAVADGEVLVAKRAGAEEVEMPEEAEEVGALLVRTVEAEAAVVVVERPKRRAWRGFRFLRCLGRRMGRRINAARRVVSAS
ncbi:hypothetical protein C8J57DRAFT_1601871 [Mycena rebaudengoi]|nr:hypothetical protein C8J57DRAFT_1601871 [Mycena rebaudengoi]